ncbi:Undecaprenyl phosphate-alpha-4-amino-4-deoxy-L-arabinose arabinosyl transferase [Caulifigura coniformis]|uniref:Undecaprenyl phosphate-alpha-4-amino-4-deoxy-L-arabinose arabinosyl transferase n=1 Tax=Caulifigura coniformis TaxID=2527983 RepID=A0A517SJA3_9PLAN|nr:glycosyltransferase family 39 protein [Caulifigura coniformis]QDT56195.1 Undecaprenyl phosphate-alpha-4-amino-4-deoxy-L-arabinose arabinosyl transferase [Caulifigura coniformis]
MQSGVEMGIAGDAPRPSRRRFWTIVFAIAAVCLLLKIPVMFRQHAAGDEDFYGVPGLTLLQEGRLRVPFMPCRDRGSMFYRGDDRLLTLPPLYFFFQAASYAVFGATIGSARLASGLAGVGAILLLGALALRITRSERVALTAVAFYAASRVVYFPWLMSRPDTLTGFFGFASMLFALRLLETRSRKDAALAGLLTGLGLYTHPFALVYTAQEGLLCLWAGRGWREKLGLASIFSATAVAVASLWLILILPEPLLWKEQFLDLMGLQVGPGLSRRLFWPGQSLPVQALVYLEHVGIWQCLLMIGSLLAATFLAVRDRSWRLIVFLSFSAMYFHVVSLGTHPTKGYWCYTGGWLWIAFAMVLDRAVAAVFQTAHARQVAFASLAGAAAFLMIPGCGLRTLVQHIRHWDDIAYDAPRFCRMLLSKLPPDATLAVDQAYVFEFYAAGRRNMITALEFPLVFSLQQYPYDLIVAGEYALDKKVPEINNGKPIATYGPLDDPFACSAVIFEAPPERRANGVFPADGGNSGKRSKSSGPI